MGLESAVLDAVGTLTDDPMHGLVLSFTSPRTVEGIAGTVDDSGLVLFTPTTLGENNTSGTFTLYFGGSDIGLTADDEDIDAFEFQDDFFLISTNRSFSVTSTGGDAAGQDEDLLLCVADPDCRFLTVLDLTGPTFSTIGSYSVPGDSGPNEDVFRCHFDVQGCFGDAATFEKFFADDDHTIAGDITGLEVPGLPGE